MDPDGVVRLLAAILRGTTSLHGAACQGRHELFDEIGGPKTREVAVALAQRHTAASQLCSRWPGTGAVPRIPRLIGRSRDLGETKIPIAGPAQVRGHFFLDQR